MASTTSIPEVVERVSHTRFVTDPELIEAKALQDRVTEAAIRSLSDPSSSASEGFALPPPSETENRLFQALTAAANKLCFGWHWSVVPLVGGSAFLAVTGRKSG